MNKNLVLLFSLLLVLKIYSMYKYNKEIRYNEEIRFLLTIPWHDKQKEIRQALEAAKKSPAGYSTISYNGFSATFCEKDKTVSLSSEKEHDTLTYEQFLKATAVDEPPEMEIDFPVNCFLQ